MLDFHIIATPDPPYDFWKPILYFLHILLEKFHDFLFFYRFEDIGSTARKERVDHRETRILCGCSDESDYPFLHPGEEDILLRFRPAMDLVEEEYSLSSFGEILLCS